ncbi:hypothetical protein C1H46_015685 [Malus baccata]|uniref:Uncharacterized protein n=1 Tax=Malus baccata TaxID=106549 RepID=A0A540MKH2_MALBA|nr:hypothetical protein C1H46_015685 [Malus baccata]
MEKRKFLEEAKACTPKPHEFLDITKASEEEMSAGETNDDEAAGEGSAAEENHNTSAKSNPGSRGHLQTFLGKGENNDGELSNMDDKKSADDVDLNEVDGFLNSDVQKEEDIERKVNKLERALELQRKELEAEKLKLKKLVYGRSKEIAVCLQLAVDQLHASISSSFSERCCFEFNSSPFYHNAICMTVYIFLTFGFFSWQSMNL